MTQNRSARRLEMALLAFFVVAAFSLVTVYATDPLLYITMFPFKLTATQRYPLPLTLFLVAIEIFIVLVILGVMRHWLFWVLWIALSCSILEIPTILFQLAGVIPGHLPVWYSFVRMSAACVAGGWQFGWDGSIDMLASGESGRKGDERRSSQHQSFDVSMMVLHVCSSSSCRFPLCMVH